MPQVHTDTKTDLTGNGQSITMVTSTPTQRPRSALYRTRPLQALLLPETLARQLPCDHPPSQTSLRRARFHSAWQRQYRHGVQSPGATSHSNKEPISSSPGEVSATPSFDGSHAEGSAPSHLRGICQTHPWLSSCLIFSSENKHSCPQSVSTPCPPSARAEEQRDNSQSQRIAVLHLPALLPRSIRRAAANCKVSIAPPPPKRFPSALGADQFRRGSYTSQLPQRPSPQHRGERERALDGKSNIILVNMFLSHLSLIFVLPHMAHRSGCFPPQQPPSLLELCVLSTRDPGGFSERLRAPLSARGDHRRRLRNELGEMCLPPLFPRMQLVLNTFASDRVAGHKALGSH